MNTHAIYFFDGGVELITKDEHDDILKAMIQKDEHIIIHGKVINTKSISRTGYHQSTADIVRINKQDEFRSLPRDQQEQLSEMRYKKACLIASKKSIAMPQKDTEEKELTVKDNGESKMYYIQNGEKMFS